jgi:hypothetical protein
MAPMVPKHPKTPSWALFAHDLAKNEEDIHLESFPFKLVLSGSPIRTHV